MRVWDNDKFFILKDSEKFWYSLPLFMQRSSFPSTGATSTFHQEGMKAFPPPPGGLPWALPSGNPTDPSCLRENLLGECCACVISLVFQEAPCLPPLCYYSYVAITPTLQMGKPRSKSLGTDLATFTWLVSSRAGLDSRLWGRALTPHPPNHVCPQHGTACCAHMPSPSICSSLRCHALFSEPHVGLGMDQSICIQWKAFKQLDGILWEFLNHSLTEGKQKIKQSWRESTHL